jgi:ABC-type transporter Mla subunit MlaD
MRESSQNFLIGITSIIAIGGVIYLLLQFGELDPFFHPSYVLTIQTDNARGLREGSVTEYNGVPIGVVNAVRIDRQRPDLPVVIDVFIDANHEVPVDVKPYAMTALLGGGAILQLEAPPALAGAAVAYHATDGGAIIESPILLKIVEQITAELDARMEPLVAALDSFKELSETYTGVGESIDAAIESLSLGEGASIQETIDNLNVVLADVGEPAPHRR